MDPARAEVVLHLMSDLLQTLLRPTQVPPLCEENQHKVNSLIFQIYLNYPPLKEKPSHLAESVMSLIGIVIQGMKQHIHVLKTSRCRRLKI